MIKQLLKAATLSLALVFASSGVQAAPIGLALVLDESGSISAAEFTLQTNGYVAALNNVLPQDGSVAVGVYDFASGAGTVFSMQVITAANYGNLITAIQNNPKSGGGTRIDLGINEARADIEAFGYANLESAVIDVSTDGFSGGNPAGAASAFVTAGLLGGLSKANVNCLGIGNNANCNFIAGAESFSTIAGSFAVIQTALESKIKRELNIPEPATLALFGLGLFGIGAAARKGRRS